MQSLLILIFAYIDPGVGSAVIQAVIAGTLGFFYALKLYGHRIKNFFRRKKEG